MIKEVLNYMYYVITSGIPKGFRRLFGYMLAGSVKHWIMFLIPILAAFILLCIILAISLAKSKRHEKNGGSYSD